jgi:hypothetical protein
MQYELFHTVQGMFAYGLSKLFPGTFEQELAAVGAIVGSGNYNPVIGGIKLSVPWERLPKPARMMAGLTRAAYETVLRRMVASDKRIEFIDGTVLGFDVDTSNAKMLGGIRYRPANDAKAVVSLKGDLVLGLSSGLSVTVLTNHKRRLYRCISLWPSSSSAVISRLCVAEGYPGVLSAKDALHDLHIRERSCYARSIL